MAHVATGTRTTTEKPNLLEQAKNFIGEHKTLAVATAVVAPTALLGALVAPSIANAFSGGPSSSEKLALFLKNDRENTNTSPRMETWMEYSNLAREIPDCVVKTSDGKFLDYEGRVKIAQECITEAYRNVRYIPGLGPEKLGAQVSDCVEKYIERNYPELKESKFVQMASALATQHYMAIKLKGVAAKDSPFHNVSDPSKIDTPKEQVDYVFSLPENELRATCAVGNYAYVAAMRSIGVETYFTECTSRYLNRGTQPGTGEPNSRGGHTVILCRFVDDAGQEILCVSDPYWASGLYHNETSRARRIGPDGSISLRPDYLLLPGLLGGENRSVEAALSQYSHFPTYQPKLLGKGQSISTSQEWAFAAIPEDIWKRVTPASGSPEQRYNAWESWGYGGNNQAVFNTANSYIWGK